MSALPTDAKIAAAQVKADAARAKLGETLAELKHRVSPQTLVNDVAESLKDKGLAIADDVADAAKRKPAVFAAAALGVGLVLARKRVARLFQRATADDARSLPSRTKRKG